MRLACLFVPDFPLAALARAQPELRGEPVAVADGQGPGAKVLAVSAQAGEGGVTVRVNGVERKLSADAWTTSYWQLPPAALRNRVEVRPDQDGRVARPPDQVPGVVDLDREAGLLQPGRGEVVRTLLALAAADTVRARPTADGIERVEPLLDAGALR